MILKNTETFNRQYIIIYIVLIISSLFDNMVCAICVVFPFFVRLRFDSCKTLKCKYVSSNMCSNHPILLTPDTSNDSIANNAANDDGEFGNSQGIDDELNDILVENNIEVVFCYIR